MHSHGHSLRELMILRHGQFERTADVVIYPGTTKDVEILVKLANENNVILVPFGGGTNVT